MTFEPFLKRAVPHATDFQTRPEGPAFLNVARNLYGFEHIDYLVLNIPVTVWKTAQFRHGRYGSDGIAQCMTTAPAVTAVTTTLAASELSAGDDLALESWNDLAGIPGEMLPESHDGLLFGLKSLHGECAVASVAWLRDDEDADFKKASAVRDLRVLLGYFHSHVLRINGVDAASDILMSARELDCLRWTAAGKTAWEASIILGISERTVRFHLNVAREKLDCATTTQAVAKAVSKQLIKYSA